MSNQTNCESCGAVLTPGARTCDSCGQPVSGTGSAEVSAQSWSQPSPVQPVSSQPSSTDRWGSPQPGGAADDPRRWGSPQAVPTSQPAPTSSARPASTAGSGSQSFDVDSAVASVKETARNWRKWLLIGGAVLLLCCLCLAAVVFLSGGALFSWLSSAVAGGY